MAEPQKMRTRVLMLLENNDYSRDVRVRQEAKSLAAHGYHVDVICPGSRAGVEAVQDGIRVWRYRARFAGDGLFGYVLEYGYAMLASFALAVRIAVRYGFDVVHAHNPPDTFVFIGLVFKLLGKRFVFDHHDLSGELYRYARFSGKPSGLVYRALLALEKLSCRAADHVIVTNESYRELAIERSRVQPERITVVRNGPELRADESLAEPAAKPATRVIGYVGIMGRQDGVDLLIRAAACLRRDGVQDFHVVLVGSGDAMDDLRELACQLDLEGVISFVGWVDPEGLAAYLRSFDVCVAPEPPNGYTELCTMIKVMEYMAFSKPVVAFDLLEHRRTAGSAALYAETSEPEALAERIKELLDDPELRAELGRRGRRRVEAELAWEYQERALLHAYSKLRSGRRLQGDRLVAEG